MAAKTTKATEKKSAEQIEVKPVVETVAQAETKTAVKKTAAKAETKASAKKTAAKTETKAAAKPARRASTKRVSAKVYIQYMGQEFEEQTILDRIVEKYVSETGKTKSSIKTLDVYIKPEDHAAYYVLNGQGDSIPL